MTIDQLVQERPLAIISTVRQAYASRKATAQDSDAVYALASGYFPTGELREFSRADLAEKIGLGTVYVIEEGAITGMSALCPNEAYVELCSVAVRDGLQKQGRGKAVVDAALADAQARLESEPQYGRIFVVAAPDVSGFYRDNFGFSRSAIALRDTPKETLVRWMQ